MSQVGTNSVRLLRLPAVMDLTGMSRTTVYRLVGEKRFPQPVRLSDPKMSVWPSDKIDQWIQAQLDGNTWSA